jgi:hypothetical protein
MYFVIMPRVNFIVILLTYVRYLYSINLPTVICYGVTRVNSTNVLVEGLRIGEIGHRMNSKVKSVKQHVYRK